MTTQPLERRLSGNPRFPESVIASHPDLAASSDASPVFEFPALVEAAADRAAKEREESESSGVALRLADRAEITMLEMVAAGHAVIEMPVEHTFAAGQYVRTIRIPGDTLLTSREHLQQHVFIISQGTISVTSELEGRKTYTAPYIGVTEPGTRRTLYAHPGPEVVWTTFHLNPDNETDPDKLILEITDYSNPLIDQSHPDFKASGLEDLLSAWRTDYVEKLTHEGEAS